MACLLCVLLRSPAAFAFVPMRPFFSLLFERFAAFVMLSPLCSPPHSPFLSTHRKHDRRRYTTQRTICIRQATWHMRTQMQQRRFAAARVERKDGRGRSSARAWGRQCSGIWTAIGCEWHRGVAALTPLWLTRLRSLAPSSRSSVSGAVGMPDHWTPSGSHRLHCRW